MKNIKIRNSYIQSKSPFIINTNLIEDLNNHLITLIDLAIKIKDKENQ